MSDDQKSGDLLRAVTVDLSKIPGVITTTKLNPTKFTVQKKVFAFAKDDGIVLKLPPQTVRRLLLEQKATSLIMGKRTIKEWVVIRSGSPLDRQEHLALFKEAMGYVFQG